jgi:hypothetical protein
LNKVHWDSLCSPPLCAMFCSHEFKNRLDWPTDWLTLSALSRIWYSKMWPWVPRDSDLRMAVCFVQNVRVAMPDIPFEDALSDRWTLFRKHGLVVENTQQLARRSCDGRRKKGI